MKNKINTFYKKNTGTKIKKLNCMNKNIFKPMCNRIHNKIGVEIKKNKRYWRDF